MPWPVDDGVSAYYWNDYGVLESRETSSPFMPNGEVIVWVEPEPDPNEEIGFFGPTIWAVIAHRLDLGPETAVTIWVEAETEGHARALFGQTAGAGMGLLAISRWEPTNLAQHLRWIAGHEGNLAAIIQRH